MKDVGNPDRDRTPLPYFYWVFRASTHLGSLYDSVKAEAWKSTLGEPWPHTRDGDEWLRRLYRLTDQREQASAFRERTGDPRRSTLAAVIG